MERTEKHKPASPDNIMMAFKQANNAISESSNLDEMIAAYDKVIGFCSNSKECRNAPSIKRNTLLYWAYNNIGNSYRKKNMPTIAYKYYQKALTIAISDKQKSMALEAMLTETGKENLKVAEKCKKIISITQSLIEIYQKQGDSDNLQRIIALFERTSEVLKKS